MGVVIFTSFQIFLLFVLFWIVGFTCLTYSHDGDIEIRKKNASYYIKESSEEKAWERLSALNSVSEVTWNKSLFVAFVSSLGVTGIISEKINLTTTSTIFFTSLAIIFGVCDTTNRWIQAHRKDMISNESLGIIQRLRPKYVTY